MARVASAWWPGGRTSANAPCADPSSTRRTASQAAPAARTAASIDPALVAVSGSSRTRRPCRPRISRTYASPWMRASCSSVARGGVATSVPATGCPLRSRQIASRRPGDSGWRDPGSWRKYASSQKRGVAEAGNHRRDIHADVDPGGREPGDRLHAALRRRDLRLEGAGVIAVPERDAHRYGNASHSGKLGQQIHVALDQRRLGDDADRIAIVPAHFQAAARQLVARLERLVAIRHAAEGDQFAFPGATLEGLAQEPRRFGLDGDLPLEVGTGAEAEVLVRGAGVAVVAHDAVGDEIARSGSDVEHRQFQTEGFNRNDSQGGIALQRGSLDDSFARNRRRNSMQEPESLSQPAADSDVARDVPPRRRLQHGIKSEPLERDTRFMKDARIRVRDAQYTAAQ